MSLKNLNRFGEDIKCKTLLRDTLVQNIVFWHWQLNNKTQHLNPLLAENETYYPPSSHKAQCIFFFDADKNIACLGDQRINQK